MRLMSNAEELARDVTIVSPRQQEGLPEDGRAARSPFADDVIAFINDLGRSLREGAQSRRYPELVALGFWARSSNIARLRSRFESMYTEAVRLPRGLAFHIAPSNVDTIFLYSLLLSMLAGNVNVVRLSSRSTDQSAFLLGRLEEVIGRATPAVGDLVTLVKFARESSLTATLSQRADLRVIWGGDETVSAIRKHPLSPWGTELVFPNKYSAALLDADAWLGASDPEGLARAFVNDTLWFGQMACSSPRSVIWRGETEAVERASVSFWTAVERAATVAALDWQDVYAVSKLLAEQGLAVTDGGRVRPTLSNRVRVVRDVDPTGPRSAPSAGHGFFLECQIRHLDGLTDLVRKNWQTLVSYGVHAAEWKNFLSQHRPAGLNRIVPIGSALDFNAVWDGVDLLTAMTRLVTVSI